MRPTKLRFHGSLGAALVLVVGGAFRADAGGCDDPGDGEPPHAIWVEGPVAAIDGERVRIGGTTLVLDPDGAGPGEDVLQTPEQMRRVLERLRVGDLVYTDGVLLRNATVRLTTIERDDGIDPASAPVAGIVRAVGAGTLTVDESVVTITGGGDFTTRFDQWTSLAGLRVGDVVCVASRRTEDGTLVGNEGAFRMSGVGTIVQGTITALNLVDDPQVQVAGVWCVLDGHEAITGLGTDPCAHGGDDMRVGWTVEVRGVLRDGKVIADRLQVVSKRPSPKRPRVRGWGYVGSAEPGRVTVNGLALATGRRVPGKAATRTAVRLRTGDRVRFSAGLTRDGDLRGSRISRL